MNKSCGTKTAHVNDSLRYSVYSGYLAAAEAPGSAKGKKASMMHPADTATPPRRHPPASDPGYRRAGGTCPPRRNAQYEGVRNDHLVSRSRDANFLEFAHAGFHYCVIEYGGVLRPASRGPAALKILRRQLRVRLDSDARLAASRKRDVRLPGPRRGAARDMMIRASTTPARSGCAPATGRSMQTPRTRKFPDATR
jgi:hypothetical protein